jgi:hypothetical protein
MPVTSYSTTPANNNSAPPNGAPEGWAPSDVNNTVRQIMTDVAVEAQVNAVKVLASVAGTNTITGSMTPDLAAYSAGLFVVATPAATNTSATVTLNIDSLGALDVFRYGGDTLQIGDLVAGVPAFFLLDSGADDFYLLNPQNTGFRSIPQNLQNGNYTLVLSDSGKHIYCSAGTNTFTIPANASVAFPVGTVVTFINGTAAANLTIAITSDTLALAGTSSTGSRTLAVRGIATAVKAESTFWVISGPGLS